MLLLISVIIACVLVYLVLKWIKIRNYWSERNVPHLPPHPIYGSLTFLQKENANLWLRRMHDRFKGPYFGIWLFWRPALVVSSPQLARDILVKHSQVFRDRFLSSGDSDPLGGLNIFTLNDPVWTDIRRKLTSVFTSAKLKSLQGFFHIKGKELVERIDKERNGRINLRMMYTDYTTDIIGTYAFGVAGNATTTGEGALRDITKEFMNFSIFRSVSWCSIFFFPELVDIFRFKYYPSSAIEYFRRIFKKMVSQREESKTEVGDLLDILVKLRRENPKYSEDFLVAQAAIVLLGGFDSGGSVLSFITYELAYNPHIQEILYQELSKAKDESGGQDLGYQTLADAVYLNCVIKEALRKYTTMGWLDRIASTDYRIDDKLTIQAGTPVYINAIGMHYDAEYFPDPDTFNPDRFLPENEVNIPPYTYMPFGEGPRVCIGQRFGLITLRYALSRVLLQYEVRPYADCPSVSEIEIEKRGIFLMPGQPLYVQFIPRSNS